MKNKKTKKIIIIASIVTLALVASLFIFERISPSMLRGDSGFDSSYDSGSSGGSSSWNSSSSHSSSDSSSSSGGSGLTTINDLKEVLSLPNTFGNVLYKMICIFFFVLEWGIIGVVIFVIVGFFIIYPIKERIKRNIKKRKRLDIEKIKSFIPDYSEEFLHNRYLDYLEIQRAWQDFDYDTLREKLTDELYNQYVMQLDTLKAKNQKNVMREFVYKDSAITDIKEENDSIILTFELITEFYDYIEENKTVVRGYDDIKITQYYEMIFVCSKKTNLNKCPNCGTKLDGNASNKCEYCGSIVTGLTDKWVLSKKKSKGQR